MYVFFDVFSSFFSFPTFSLLLRIRNRKEYTVYDRVKEALGRREKIKERETRKKGGKAKGKGKLQIDDIQ